MAQKEAVRATYPSLSDSRPLGSSNAVEFMFLCQGVWQLWACPLSRSGWGLAQKGAVRATNRCHRIAGLLVALTPLNSCFYRKAFGCYERFYFVRGDRPPPQQKWISGEQLGGQTSPLGSLLLVCYNPSKSVFISQSVWLPSACLC